MSEAAVAALTHAVLVSMAEAQVDMVIDHPADHSTKDQIEDRFQCLHPMSQEYIADVLAQLNQRVSQELAEKRYTAKVTALHYGSDGQLADVDVDLVFNKPA